MEVVKIVFVSAIIFPFLATAGVMIFVARAMRKRKIERDELREKTELTDALEEVIMKQDKVLGQYRKMLD